MRCNECRDKFSEYLDGRLSPGAAGEFERHLAACARCARELDDLRALLGVVRATPAVPVPEGFVERVHRRVAPLGAPRRAPVWRWVAVSAATAVLALTALAVFGPTLGPRERVAVAPSAPRTATAPTNDYGEADRPAAKTLAPGGRAGQIDRFAAPEGPDRDSLAPRGDAKAPSRPAGPPPSGAVTLPPAARREPATAPMFARPAGEETREGTAESARRPAATTLTLETERAAAGLGDARPAADKAGAAAGGKAKVMNGVVAGPDTHAAGAPPPKPTAPSPAPPYSAEDETIKAGQGAAKPARVRVKPAPTLSAVPLAWATPQPPPSWCLLTLRKPAAQGRAPGLLVESRVEARSASLHVRRLARLGGAASLPRFKSRVTRLEDVPFWQARLLPAGTTTVLALERFAQPAAAPRALLGALPLSAVYLLTLSADNQPACRYLLFVPPPGVAPSAVAPPGPAIDVLRALTAQSGIYLLTPDISVGAPQLALTPMPPQQALASALQMLGLTVHKDDFAWTAR